MAPTRLAAAAAFFVRQAKGSDTGLLAAGAVGWVGLAMTANPTFMQYCVGANSAAARVGAYFDLAAQTGYALETAVHWALMVCAMMLPLLVEPLRYVAFRSLRRTRRMNVASFLIGYRFVAVGSDLGVLAKHADELCGVRQARRCGFEPSQSGLQRAIRDAEWQCPADLHRVEGRPNVRREIDRTRANGA